MAFIALVIGGQMQLTYHKRLFSETFTIVFRNINNDEHMTYCNQHNHQQLSLQVAQ
jgi:hypothetical protein